MTFTDEAAIRDSEQELGQAFFAGDPDAIVSLYTEDVILAFLSIPTVQGRDAFRELAAQLQVSEIELVVDDVTGEGDYAAAIGRAQLVMGDQTLRRRFLQSWRREADGRWRIAREVVTDDV